jgi:hypothetical protein
VRSTESTQLIEVSEHYKKRYEAVAHQFPEQDILRYIKQTNELGQALRWAVQPRYHLESGLIQMVKMESSLQISELLQQIELLKKKISNNGNSSLSKSAADLSQRENPPSTELKVMGEVGAGYLSSKSAVSYSSLIGTDLMKLAGVSKLDKLEYASPRVAASSTTIQSVSSEEVIARWSDFVSDVSKTHIAVGTLLMETKVIDVHGGIVRVSCPDAYHFSTLKRHRNFLVSALHQVVGKHIAIEPVLLSSNDIPVKPVYVTTVGPNNGKRNAENGTYLDVTATKEHPILTMLKRELGAERVE